MKTTKLQKTQNGNFVIYDVVTSAVEKNGIKTVQSKQSVSAVVSSEKDVANLLHSKGIRSTEILFALEAMEQEVADIASFGAGGGFTSIDNQFTLSH